MNALILTNIDEAEISLAPSTIEQRDKFVLAAAQVRAVFDDDSQNAAIAASRDLKNLRTGVEAARVAVKAPVLALGRRIDEIAQSVTTVVSSEENRVNGLISGYQKRLKDQAEEAERKRLAEEARLVREEAERAAEVERRAVAAAQALAKAAADRDQGAIKAARAQAAEAQRLADQLALDQEAAELDRQLAVPVPVPGKVAGLSVTEKYTFEVIEIMSFSRAYPDMVNFEIKTRDVNQAIKDGVFTHALEPGMKAISSEYQVDENTVIGAPGLRIFKDVRSSVR